MPWQQLTLYTTKEHAETLSGRLESLGAASVTMQDAADQPLYEPPPGATPLWQLTNVVGLFDDSFDMDLILTHLRNALGGELPEHALEVPEDQDWERAWMDDFKPMHFGARRGSVPGWGEGPAHGGVNNLV